MIKKLDKLIIGAFIGPFIATFFITTFVLVLQFFWLYIDDIVGKGLDLLTVGRNCFHQREREVHRQFDPLVVRNPGLERARVGRSRVGAVARANAG